MTEQNITCPSCGEEILLTEALSQSLEEEMEKKFDTRFKKACKDIELKTTKKVEGDLKLEIEDLLEQVQEKEDKLVKAVEIEKKLRKQQRELEDKEKSLELEMERKLDDERKKILDEARKNLEEENKLKDREKDKQVEDLKKQIIDMKRKLEQGSQQMQGEVFELELEGMLAQNFIYDEITPVPTGIKGGDIIQKVNLPSGKRCGTIIWEIKNTLNWNQNWISKLKLDQKEANADLAILVTRAMPEDIQNFEFMDNVLVTNYESALPVTSLLRNQLINVSRVKHSEMGKTDKKDILYEHITSPGFYQNAELLVRAFIEMEAEHNKEVRSMTRIWKRREKQINQTILSIAELYGGLQGIIGGSLPQIKELELPELPPQSTLDIDEEEESSE